ncbi:energy transducer TonB [bacterium]|nr:energy transducer TonB [bacterium]
MLRFLFNFIITASLACFLNASSLFADNTTDSSEPQKLELDSYPSPVGGFGDLMKQIEYSESGRKSGTTGKVLLAVSFDDKGTVVEVEVVESLGKDFDTAAVNAVKSVQWKPAISNNKSVACRIHLPIEFKLQDKK